MKLKFNRLKPLLACFLLVGAMTVSAQSQADIEKQKATINKIKKNTSDYIYAETTLPDAKSALDLAQDLLYQNINEYVANRRKFAEAGKVVTVNTNYVTEKITLPRGNMFRAFLYVNKDDIIPASNVAVTSSNTTAKAVTVGTPTNAAPKTTTKEPETKRVVAKPSRNAIINSLLQLKSFQDAKKQLKTMKSKGEISSYDMYENLTNPQSCLLLVFDANGNIRALLSDGAKRINLQTSRADDLRKYKGCGAIGIEL